MKTYIELWKAKQSWLSLPQDQRADYLSKMQPSIGFFLEKGSSIISWGKNTDANDQKADYDWFSIWQFPDDGVLAEFEALLQGAGWYDYFDQINVGGEHVGPEEVIGQLINL